MFIMPTWAVLIDQNYSPLYHTAFHAVHDSYTSLFIFSLTCMLHSLGFLLLSIQQSHVAR
jgi:hypothetical protein